MGQGIDLAKEDNPEHAEAMENFRDQLIIVLLKRLGADKAPLEIPVAETDDTGQDLCLMAIRDGNFVFNIRKKT